VMVTLTATDPGSGSTGSGVYYTAYEVDSGGYYLYTGTFTVSAIGSHTVYFYSVDNAGNVESTVSTSFTVLNATSATLTSSANPSTGGETVTFTATVKPAAGGTPTGYITFYNGSTSIGILALSGGVAKLNYSALTAGTHSMTAVYAGSSTDATSTSAALSQVVNYDTTTTVLTASPNPSTSGQTVALTATVTPHNVVAATGEVSFYSGTTLLGNVALSGGVATLNHAFTGGSYSLSAKYDGSNYKSASTSPAVTQTVSKLMSGTALASSLNPSVYGQSVTFTATVTPSGPPAPTGTVAFSSNGTAMTGCSAVTVSATTHTAACTTTALAVGTDSIEAVYAGDANYLTSVSQATSTTAVTASPASPSTGGETVTFTATVTPQFGGTISGDVTFLNGSTSIGIVAVNTAGVAKLNYATLTAGSTHSITAVYAGSTNIATSTSPVLSYTVNYDTTTTVLTSSPNPSTTVQSVTLTATVTPGNGVAATGEVSFYSGTTLLGNAALSGGVATLAHTFTTTGTYSLTAKYDGSYFKSASTSTAITQTVNAD
ncbi:MAG: Ig-like domain-containing protein, partial [Terriglobales bacterium]